MTEQTSASGFLGTISAQNKHEFPESIQKVFDYMETNPDAPVFETKIVAAQWQQDKNIAYNILQTLPQDTSLKEALSTVLSRIPDNRADQHMRAFVQWFIAHFETTNPNPEIVPQPAIVVD